MRGVDKTGFPICCERGETFCDRPQVRGGVICCKKTCGPDITDELEATLDRVRRAFAGWSGPRRYAACLGIVTVPSAASAWDIEELGPAGRESFVKKYQPDCGTCGLSVQVGRDCHYAGSVNYVIYGLMMRLCHDDFVKDGSSIADWFSQQEMLELVYIHKNFNTSLTQGANFQASNEWALVGYRNGPLRPIPPGDRKECNNQLCGKKYSGRGFTVQWSYREVGPR